MICTAVSYRRISRAASMPLMPGMSTSKNSTSKRTLRGVQLELTPYTKPMELLADIEAGVRYCSRKSCI